MVSNAWRTYRPEGHPLQYTLKRPWRIFWYLKKYLRKNFLTSAAELSQFNNQRLLLSALRETPLYAVNPGSSVNLAVVGDLMWVRANWDGFLNPEVRRYLSSFDALLGNLESPIDTEAPATEWYKLDAAKFNSDARLLSSFRHAQSGNNLFTALSFANNHAFDRGDAGAVQTLKFLRSQGIKQSGLRTSADEPGYIVFERNGIRFGMYAACYGYNDPHYRSRLHLNVLPGLAPEPQTVDSVDTSSLERVLKAMEQDKVDFKILFIHWGHEFELYPTPVQRQLGRKFAALGFDLIAGSHPHVVQPPEVCFVNGYERILTKKDLRRLAGMGTVIEGCGGVPRKSLIYYSLGNFVTAMLFWEPKFGVIQSINVFRNPETGRVDWQLPQTEFVYNLLAIHNHGRKELVLLKPFLLRNKECLKKHFPLNRAAAGYLYRHLSSPMTEADLLRGPCERDYQGLVSGILGQASSVS